MIERKILIINKLGLHARAAAKFVKLASTFESEIQVCREVKGDKKIVNGKSIMGVMMLAASMGTEIVLKSEGIDAEAAMESLEALINDRFEEEE